MGERERERKAWSRCGAERRVITVRRNASLVIKKGTKSRRLGTTQKDGDEGRRREAGPRELRSSDNKQFTYTLQHSPDDNFDPHNSDFMIMMMTTTTRQRFASRGDNYMTTRSQSTYFPL